MLLTPALSRNKSNSSRSSDPALEDMMKKTQRPPPLYAFPPVSEINDTATECVFEEKGNEGQGVIVVG